MSSKNVGFLLMMGKGIARESRSCSTDQWAQNKEREKYKYMVPFVVGYTYTAPLPPILSRCPRAPCSMRRFSESDEQSDQQTFILISFDLTTTADSNEQAFLYLHPS